MVASLPRSENKLIFMGERISIVFNDGFLAKCKTAVTPVRGVIVAFHLQSHQNSFTQEYLQQQHIVSSLGSSDY